MAFLFWRKNKRQAEKLDALERDAAKVHQTNINTIATARHKVDTLNKVLKQNNIVFQLAHVIGEGHHK